MRRNINAELVIVWNFEFCCYVAFRGAQSQRNFKQRADSVGRKARLYRFFICSILDYGRNGE